MGKCTNNKYQIEDRRTKNWAVNSWKRLQIFDPKNFRCFKEDDRTRVPYSIIDFRIDEDNDAIVFKNISGVNVRESVLVLVLLADKDVKKHISENWDRYVKFGYSISYREGMSGHQYNTATRWTDVYHGRKYQHIDREKFEWSTNSTGKLDYQASPFYVPIWVLIAYDLELHKEYVDAIVANNHEIAETLTEEEKYNYHFEGAKPYKWCFEKRTKNMVKNTLRKKDGVRFKYTPGYRISSLQYEEQKKAHNLLYMCD